MTRIISLTGGRAGVGKTAICVALAERLAAAGQRVCVLALIRDAALAGISQEIAEASTFSDTLSGKGCGGSPLLSLPQGYDLALGADTDSWLRWLSPDRMEAFTERLKELDDYDFVLVDAGTGLSQNQLAFSLACPELLVVLTPEPAVLADTYTLLKLLYAEQYAGTIGVLVNKSPDLAEGRQTFDRFGQIAGHYLDLDMRLTGVVCDHPGFTPVGPSAGDGEPLPGARAELEALAGYLRDHPPDNASVPMETWCRHVLRAVGPLDADDIEVATLPALTRPPSDDELQGQLARLTGQVDALVAEIDRLRGLDSSEAENHAHGTGLPENLADLADRSEYLTVDDYRFAIYCLDRPGDSQQYFAWHTVDDDPDPSGSAAGTS
jgi:MinD-like ATPase involved in chromosome partitioning or flagellar assembly